MKEYIESLTLQFTNEAQLSPLLCSDMAQLEKYMAESYSNRAMSELIQNADDANAKRVMVKFANDNLYFANDGNNFSKNDISAICRSGASNKNRGKHIGYRGVGFKSTTAFSNYILIYSNNCFFSFSKTEIAKRLNISEQNVPTVRIPVWVDLHKIEQTVLADINEIKSRGFTTIFVFKNANTEICKNEMSVIDDGCMVFLRNITEFIVDESTIFKSASYKRKITKHEKYYEAIILDNITNSISTWQLLVNHGSPYVAYKLHNKCDTYDKIDRTPVFHCYLPTLDFTGFGFRINGDFSTDPSRKHIIQDLQTQHELDRIGVCLAKEIIDQFQLNAVTLPDIINSIIECKSQSQFGSRINYIIYDYLSKEKWLISCDGHIITPSDALLLPKWADESFEHALLNVFPDYSSFLIRQSNDNFRTLLHRLGANDISANVFLTVLQHETAVMMLTELTSLSALSAILTKYRSDEHFDIHSIKKCCIIFDGKVVFINSFFDDANRAKKLINKIAEFVDRATINWLYQKFNIQKNHKSPISNILKNRKVIPRWQTAEQLCLEIEIKLGYNAKDVSEQNLGYDVVSEDTQGNFRYIEVKSVSHIGDNVILTNNEYATAHKLGEQYYLCIVSLANNLSVVYIRNPLSQGHINKRVRMWEWVYSNYSGDIIDLSL